MSLPAYPSYKDSGVPWLGMVPKHWEVRPSRRLFSQSRERSLDADEQLSATQKYGVVPQSLFMEREDQKVTLALSGIENFKHVCQNDFVISLRSFQGGIEHSAYDGCVSPAYTVLKPAPSVFFGFFRHLLKSPSYIGELQSVTNGIRDGKNISYEEFGIINLPLPPIAEQQAIAAWLDERTGRIDEAVAAQRALLDTLKEKRRALIAHAVTRGLDPAAPLRDSGIPWLGMVPAHWEVRKVKNYFKTCSGGTPNTSQQELYYTSQEAGIPWVRTTDLQNDAVRSVELYITDQAMKDTACSILPRETVLLAMYGGDGTVGKNGILDFPAAINQAVCALLPSDTHAPRYVFRFIQFYRPYWMIDAESSRKDPNISQELVRNAPFPLPPLAEQQAIAAYLDAETAKLDELAAETERAITLLLEHRTALIAEAVTGKLRVTGGAPLNLGTSP